VAAGVLGQQLAQFGLECSGVRFDPGEIECRLDEDAELMAIAVAAPPKRGAAARIAIEHGRDVINCDFGDGHIEDRAAIARNEATVALLGTTIALRVIPAAALRPRVALPGLPKRHDGAWSRRGRCPSLGREDVCRLGGDGREAKARPSARLTAGLQGLLAFLVIGKPKLAALGLGLFLAQGRRADGRPERGRQYATVPVVVTPAARARSGDEEIETVAIRNATACAALHLAGGDVGKVAFQLLSRCQFPGHDTQLRTYLWPHF
jgi:hypothetical protein